MFEFVHTVGRAALSGARSRWCALSVWSLVELERRTWSGSARLVSRRRRRTRACSASRSCISNCTAFMHQLQSHKGLGRGSSHRVVRMRTRNLSQFCHHVHAASAAHGGARSAPNATTWNGSYAWSAASGSVDSAAATMLRRGKPAVNAVVYPAVPSLRSKPRRRRRRRLK